MLARESPSPPTRHDAPQRRRMTSQALVANFRSCIQCREATAVGTVYDLCTYSSTQAIYTETAIPTALGTIRVRRVCEATGE
jgi:hypothetical protein